ncbi:MAG: Sec-independent protein translocase subunit TatA [Actinomycetales bacterium]
MRGLFEGWHLIVILVVVLLLFGYKRLPDAARSLGRSMRIFKSEVDSMREGGEDKKPSGDAGSSTASGSNQPLSGRIIDDGTPRQQSEATGDERR